MYSMTRVSWRHGISAMYYAPDRTAIVYGDLPNGLTLYSAMRKLAKWIEADLREKQFRVDLVHAHKASTDAIVGNLLASQFRVPLVLSLWGNADSQIMSGRPDLHQLWKEIADRSVALFPISPTSSSRLASVLGLYPGKTVIIPAVGNTKEPVSSCCVAAGICEFVSSKSLQAQGSESFGEGVFSNR